MAVPLTTIGDVELSTGKTITDEDRATYLINVISAYIASYCDLLSFAEVEDDTVRLQADYYGIIELGGGPISVVTSVTTVDGTEVAGYTFDGARMITGLGPFQTVDIVYTHGEDEVPADIQGLAADAVGSVVHLNSTGPLKVRTVGDVTYGYYQGGVVVSVLSEAVLDRYRKTEYTWRLGPHNTPEVNYPINWYQIGG